MVTVSEWLSKHSNLTSLVLESIVLIKCYNPLPQFNGTTANVSHIPLHARHCSRLCHKVGYHLHFMGGETVAREVKCLAPGYMATHPSCRWVGMLSVRV